jgi:phytoene synthase
MDSAGRYAADDTAYLTALVREQDRPRYYATLFAPSAVRTDLFALYGFAAELQRIPDLVKDPTLGEMRFTWWRDALVGEGGQGAGSGEAPALRALQGAMTRHSLPLAPLEALIEARSADLYSNAPGSLSDVEGRLGETESALFQMAAIICGASGRDSAEAAGHAGIAYGVARRVAAFAPERARGRAILPARLLGQEQLTVVELFAGSPPPALHNIVSAMLRFAQHHLRNAREHLKQVPEKARVAFLPLAVVDPLIRRIDQMDSEILLRPVALSDLEMLLRIGWARLRGLESSRTAISPSSSP